MYSHRRCRILAGMWGQGLNLSRLAAGSRFKPQQAGCGVKV